MSNKILIVGGGISGIVIANNIYEDNDVWLIDKNEYIGGLSYDYSCKATDKCNYCGWCLLDENIKDLKKNKKIKILINSYISNIKYGDRANRFNINIINKKNDELIYETFSHVILASGSIQFDAKKKARFGYGKFKNVITGYELEKNLRIYDFGKNKNIAFIQCVGSRDESLNALYCSKICCKYAIRMINFIVHKFPDTDITIYYMDLQLDGKDIKTIYDDLINKQNIKFIRGVPEYLEEKNNKIKARFENTLKADLGEKEYDLVVLSIGLSPNPDNKKFSRMFGVNLDENGFIITDQSGRTNIEGIYAAGTSSSPDSIKNSIINARAVCEVIK